jgi:hypothetical protein
MSTMSHVADKNGMIARCATQVVVILRCQGAEHSGRPFLLQPIWALALRAVCCVRLLAKGITIRVVAYLASQSRKAKCVAMWDVIRGSLAFAAAMLAVVQPGIAWSRAFRF